MSRPPPVNGYRNGSNPALAGPNNSSQSRLGNTGPGAAGAAPAAPTASSGMSRAERFEDEKRRIIESCFSKLDANGQLAESYITHIRITEDAQHPSTPAPPDSPETNKKPRLIIIAVRSTGRVRMHKARENNNGSFSIGKTWNLEELSAIENFANGPNVLPPQNEREAQHRAWAGNTGFTVTITKPYYWQAGTAKEKDFFIASAVKIYRKYTKGLVPELKGFDERERAMMLGQTPSQQQVSANRQAPGQGQTSLMSPGLRAESRDASPMAPPQPPFAQRPQSREESRYRQSPGPPPSLHDPSPASRQTSQSPVPNAARMPLRSPTRELVQPSPLGASRPGTSSDQTRAGGPDRLGGGEYPAGRPGTSPAPGPRSPYPPSLQPTAPSVQTPNAPSVISVDDSPSVSSFASSAGPTRYPQGRPTSPARQPEQTPQATGAAAGASLFASTKQRWMAQQQQPSQPAQQRAPQLPPIETSSPLGGEHEPQPQHRDLWSAKTANTDGAQSSPGTVDLGDAAAVNALTGFWGGDPNSAGVPQTPIHRTPIIQEPGSPPTPERSKRRLQQQAADDRNGNESLDLRPAPLRQTSAQQREQDDAPPEIKPLAVRDKRQSREPPERKLAMPGAFQESPLGPSPLSTPAQESIPTAQSEPGTTNAGAANTVPAEAAVQQRSLTQSSQADTPTSPADDEEASQYRPGLGPMIKKNAVRDRFKKAAMTANAFKPRPGGAAEKILRAKAEREAGASPELGAGKVVDGVSGFVPRPSAPVAAKEEAKSAEVSGLGIAVTEARSPPEQQSRDATPTLNGKPAVQLADNAQPAPSELLHPSDAVVTDVNADLYPQQDPSRIRRPSAVAQQKIHRRSITQQRNLAALGIDPALLADKALGFDSLLESHGWSDRSLQPKALAALELEIRREQGRLEVGAWLGGTDSDSARAEKVAQVESLLEKAIAECDELEGLLTLYSVELGSLNDDVAFIEAQSQGLQVQSANQKGLLVELSTLVDTLRLEKRELRALQVADLGDERGLEDVEACLSRLWKALIVVEPTLSGKRPRGEGEGGDAGEALSQMRALREKKQVYEREVTAFVQRLMQFLDATFASTWQVAKGRLLRPTSATSWTRRLDKDALVEVRGGLWAYGPLMLFVRDANQPAWQTLLRMYHSRAQPVYGDSFKENIAGWKRAGRKPAPEEVSEVLFTAADREESSSAGGAAGAVALASRKLTIKRSQTLAKTLRSANGGNRSPTESRHIGQLMGAEVFAGAMDEMAPLVSQEQNFLAEFFHASSYETQDFLEAIASGPPDQRGRNVDLRMPRPLDPDREMAKRVQSTMTEIFTFFATELGILLEWAVADDPLQGVGVMACLSRHSYYLQETSQEFLVQLVDKLQEKLRALWSKFVDEQVRAIEDAKARLGATAGKKRRGVLGFVKVFPQFCVGVENIFSAVAREEYERFAAAETVVEVRRLVDETYGRLNKAMFESLQYIVKESSASATGGAPHGVGVTLKGLTQEETEDKEVLNAQILLIENMNHYVEEVDDLGGKLSVLAEWKGKATQSRTEAMDRYVSIVVRRPLGKLLDFLDSLDAQMSSHPNPSAIASRPTFSRKAARNVFSQYDSSSVRKGIDVLRKRIEKHFGEADEEQISRNLVTAVCKECQKVYERTLERMENAVKAVWPAVEGEKAVEIEFGREDLRVGFNR